MIDTLNMSVLDVYVHTFLSHKLIEFSKFLLSGSYVLNTARRNRMHREKNICDTTMINDQGNN